MAVVAHIAEGIRPVVDLVYPPRCPSCGTGLSGQHGLCPDCWSALEIPAAEGGAADIVPIHAATIYNDTSRRLVLAFKHGRRIALARLMARLMASRLPISPPDQPPILLVPVPLHRWRLWQRGFNQAGLLAQELAKLGKGEVVVDGLTRLRRTPSLGGLGRDERDTALLGAIALNARRLPRLSGRDIMLIDDVFTSGATTRACIAALTSAKPRSIAVACFAKV
jgi:ComF family protein